MPGWILTTLPDNTKYYITRGPQQNVVFTDPSNPGSFISAAVYGPPALSQIVEPSGNSIVINTNKIYHLDPSNNVSAVVNIVRDGQGRITAIYDPNGGTNGLPLVQYVYNQDSGNLIQVIKLLDRNSGTCGTNRYDYNNPQFPHYITSIENADGVPVTRNFYDSSGRTVQTLDANGNTNLFIYAATNMETTVDPLGHTNTFVYDASGNIIARTNALGQVALMAYDSDNNKTNKVTFLNGLPYATNSYSYDGNKCLLSSCDPLGNINGFTYNGLGEALTSTDARGYTTYNFYDADGTLTNSTDALGYSNVNVYSDGLMVSSKDPIGTTTTNSYDSSGNLIFSASIGSSGAILSSNTYTYDLNNNRLTSSVWRHVGLNWTNATTTNIYDAQNRIIQTINPDGGANSVIYDLVGRQEATIDPLGHTNTFVYDAMGRVIETQYQDGTASTSAYDAVGNRTNSIDQLDRTTIYQYDALNRLTNTIYPDTNTSTTVYDDLGRVSQTIDARGTITANAYDADGRRIAVTNAFGITGISSTTYYTYDPNGNPITSTDANDHSTTNVYDALNRQTQVQYPDGTTNGTVYDADGRAIIQVNQDGFTTHVAYDGAGRLIAVTNALNQVTQYQYDEAGNQIAQIDALNRVNAFVYDGMGRRISHTMPGLQSEGFAYDLDGNVKYQTNYNGVVNTNQYDLMNRLINVISTNGYNISYAYSATGQRINMIDPSGTTAYAYDLRDRLLSKTNNWSNGPVVSLHYAYDPDGNVTNIYSIYLSTSNGVNLAIFLRSIKPLN